MKRLRVLSAAPFVLVIAAYLSRLAAWYDRLPDPMAIHFSGLGGRPDGFAGLGAYAVVNTALLAVIGAGWVLCVRRSTLWGAWATAGFTGGLLILLLVGNLDVAEATETRFPIAATVMGLQCAIVAALVGLVLTRLVPKDPVLPRGAGAASRLDLGAHEAAVWSRTTGSRLLTVLAVSFAVAGLGFLVLTPWPGALLGLIGLAIGVPGLALARIRVTADRRGLTVTSSVIPRPRVRVPLADIASATVRHINPVTEYGGWGYRVRPHGTGVVLRSGEAIVVRRANGREFAVTVPDAGTAAALLNTLAAPDEAADSADSAESTGFDAFNGFDAFTAPGGKG